MTTSAARGFLGAGDLFASIFNPVTKAWDDWAGPYEGTKFEIKPNSELKEQVSRGKTTYGQVTESVPIPKPADLALVLSEVNRASMAMALFGTATEVNTSAETYADLAVVAKEGKWVDIGHANLSSADLAVTNSAGDKTYVLGTDYIINYAYGMIKALVDGEITDGQALKIDCATVATSGTEIAGATQNQVRARFRLDGKNFADSKDLKIEVYEAVLTPDNAFDFLGDDFAQINLKGRMKTPEGKTEPFKVTLLD